MQKYDKVGTPKNKQKGHNGLLFLVLLVLGVGFTIGAVLYSFVEQLFIVPDLENLLYLKYSWFVYPLSFFVIAFMHVDAYNRALGNAVTGSLIKEITQRVFIFISAFKAQTLSKQMLKVNDNSQRIYNK